MKKLKLEATDKTCTGRVDRVKGEFYCSNCLDRPKGLNETNRLVKDTESVPCRDTCDSKPIKYDERCEIMPENRYNTEQIVNIIRKQADLDCRARCPCSRPFKSDVTTQGGHHRYADSIYNYLPDCREIGHFNDDNHPPYGREYYQNDYRNDYNPKEYTTLNYNNTENKIPDAWNDPYDFENKMSKAQHLNNQRGEARKYNLGYARNDLFNSSNVDDIQNTESLSNSGRHIPYNHKESSHQTKQIRFRNSDAVTAQTQTSRRSPGRLDDNFELKRNKLYLTNQPYYSNMDDYNERTESINKSYNQPSSSLSDQQLDHLERGPGKLNKKIQHDSVTFNDNIGNTYATYADDLHKDREHHQYKNYKSDRFRETGGRTYPYESRDSPRPNTALGVTAPHTKRMVHSAAQCCEGPSGRTREIHVLVSQSSTCAPCYTQPEPLMLSNKKCQVGSPSCNMEYNRKRPYNSFQPDEDFRGRSSNHRPDIAGDMVDYNEKFRGNYRDNYHASRPVASYDDDVKWMHPDKKGDNFGNEFEYNNAFRRNRSGHNTNMSECDLVEDAGGFRTKYSGRKNDPCRDIDDFGNSFGGHLYETRAFCKNQNRECSNDSPAMQITYCTQPNMQGLGQSVEPSADLSATKAAMRQQIADIIEHTKTLQEAAKSVFSKRSNRDFMD